MEKTKIRVGISDDFAKLKAQYVMRLAELITEGTGIAAPHSGKKSSLLHPLLPEQNRLISVPLPAYLPAGRDLEF
jgi:hypothetical protein